MASSNRHWPRMFKSKPCSNQPWHHDLTITTPSPMLSSTSHKSPYTSGCEERTLEPKPRWNPKPEQIQILEAIFNSGMINPPREEIHRIRLQLQQYGQVGDANVFYWFQNRKSRTKNKNRHLPSSRANNRSSTGTGGATNASVIPITGIATPNIGILANVNASSNSNSIMTSPLNNLTAPITMTTQTSSSSSSERSSGSSKPLKPVHVPMSVPEPVTMYNNIHCSTELSSLPEPFLFQNPNGYCFSIPELTGLIAAPSDQVTGVGLGLWNEPIGHGLASPAAGTEDDHVGVKRKNNTDINSDELHLHQYRFGLTNDHELLINNGAYKIGLHHDCCFQIQPTDHIAVVANSASAAAESVVTAAVETGADGGGACAAARTLLYCAPVNVMQDNSGGEGMGRLTVFIDEKPYQVPTSPLNVKSAFGNFVLVHSSGYPVPTDELHNTLQPLQHGASYYLVPV